MSAVPASAHETSHVIRAEGNYFGTVRRRYAVSGLHMSETAYGVGAYIPPHRHECPSFFMPLRGTFEEGCANTVASYGAGDVGYHPPHEPHWLTAHPSRGMRGTQARGFAVEVGDAWRAAFGGDTPWERVPRDLSRSRIPWLMGRLYAELQVHDSARPLVIEALGVELGAQLAALPLNRVRKGPPEWLTVLRDRLRDEWRETPSLTALAQLAGVTPAAVIKGFRRHEGCTPGSYLRTQRLIWARQQLAGSLRPLSAIALDAGFYDASHFTHAFKAVAGVTPTEYRHTLLG